MRLLLALALGLVLASVPVAAQPAEVRVGIYALNVGKFDVSTGSYTVDFYLSFRCDRPCEPGEFEFANGRATSTDTLIDAPTEKFYRIQAALSQNIDLRSYPFDRHNLTIALEDKRQTVEQLRYRADPGYNGVDPAVVIVGWELDGWEASVDGHAYEPYNETFSLFRFQLQISRVPLAAFLKSFLPVFFMVFVALLSLLLRADKVVARLSLNISTLLAAVMFHLNLTSSIPPVGYLTFADRFMLVTYLIMIAVLLSSILLMRHTDAKDEGKAGTIYGTALYGIPAAAVLLYLALFLLR